MSAEKSNVIKDEEVINYLQILQDIDVLDGEVELDELLELTHEDSDPAEGSEL